MSFFKNLFLRVKQFAGLHKKTAVLVGVVVVGGGYYLYQISHTTGTVTKYIVQKAAQDTVIASVSGSGQVEAVTTIDVKPEVSETVTKVYVHPGDHVVAGQVLLQMDPTNEEKALKQAQLSLQSAQLSLAKLQEAPATTTLLQDQNSIVQAQESIVNASTSLTKDYQGSFTSISSAFIDFQTVMTGLQDFAVGNEINKSQDNPDAYVGLMPTYLQGSTNPYRQQVGATYQAAAAAYQQNLIDYHAASRLDSAQSLNALLSETYQTAQTISEAVKSAKDMVNFVVNNYPIGQGFSALPSITNTFQTNLGNYTATIDSDVTNLANTQNTIVTDGTSLNNANQSLSQAQAALNQLQSGVDPIDIQSQQLSIQQSELSLQTAEQNLSYTSLRAPIDGTVSAVGAIVGEMVTTPAVSMVGSGNQAQVTLNEVDAAKVVLGDKATLSFDAISGLSLAGTVVQLDPVGTVSQGVVNYNVEIGFVQPADTSSTNLVKPGMSVTADIVTQVDQNVIAVPNAAIKSSGGAKYILEPSVPVSDADISASASGGMVLSAVPKMVPVTVGLSNSTLTEIVSGINIGDQIITQSIVSSASTVSASSAGGTNALRALGVGGGGGFVGGGGGAGAGGARVITGGGAAAGR